LKIGHGSKEKSSSLSELPVAFIEYLLQISAGLTTFAGVLGINLEMEKV
jgi:hypothetical protein